MRGDLVNNYDAALQDADQRGVAPRVRQLETRLQSSIATINIAAKVLRVMVAGHNYVSYYKRLDANARKYAEREYHGHRVAVDGKIHTGYADEILSAALSVDGRGLTNYGQITLQLKDVTIEDRASVLCENAFAFYERHDLGRRTAIEPAGWRSVWSDRALLGVAQLAPTVTPTVAEDQLSVLVQYTGPTRHDDRYLEVHIYGDLSWQTLSKVTLEKPLTDAQDREDWEFGRQKLGKRGVIFDPVNP